MGIKNGRKILNKSQKTSAHKRTGDPPCYCVNEKGYLKTERVIGSDNVKKWRINPSSVVVPRVIYTPVDRNEELKAMKAYKKNVTKSPETANAFLKRIGALDIK